MHKTSNGMFYTAKDLVDIEKEFRRRAYDCEARADHGRGADRQRLRGEAKGWHHAADMLALTTLDDPMLDLLGPNLKARLARPKP